MGRIFDTLQPAIKSETKRVFLYNAVGVVLMFIVFYVLSLIFPDSVPFDYTVILGGVCCGLVAVFNFFLMSLMVQRVADEKAAEALRREEAAKAAGVTEVAPKPADSDNAEEAAEVVETPEDKAFAGRIKKIVQRSYYRRFLMQILWMVAAILIPCFNPVAGIVPLLFTGIGIKAQGILQFFHDRR